MSKGKTRLDVAVVERGLAATRAKAQSLIMARRIRVGGLHVDKAGHPVKSDDEITVDELEHPWVGRGGMKLAGAFATWPIDVTGRTCADIGASTGGFTDVLLTRGATRVYAIDVGHGQLDQRLREDPRVVNREKVNARFLVPEDFPEPITFVAIDVSFIPLRLILPAVASCLAEGGDLIALIKPQFEVGREAVGKGGIVRDDAARTASVDAVHQTVHELGLSLRETIESPVRGMEGNIEYLMWVQKPHVATDESITSSQ